MTPPTYIYTIMYKDKLLKIHFYTGITSNLDRRMTEHLLGITRTTNRFNKSYNIMEVRYREFDVNSVNDYEKVFKKYSRDKKLKITQMWKRLAG